MATTMTATPADTSFFGHPRGLSTLFFSEMWERFSYYGMRGFLIFYMTAAVSAGGMGLDTATAAAIYGTYTSLVYLMSVPGGWLADRVLGQRKAVLYGGILIAAGHYTLAVPIDGSFYLGLVLIVLGTGLLKPNISVIVGQLYGPQDVRRDAGFSIFYMGINLGAFLGPLLTGYLAQDEGFRAMLSGWGMDPNSAWHWAFGAAGVGMTLGLIQYVVMGRWMGSAGLTPGGATTPELAAKYKGQAIRYAGGALVSPMWLVMVYLVHTYAELCLSPVGLSSMTKLAPARVVGSMMGVWFLGASVGNFMAGQLAAFYEEMPLERLFMAISILPIVAGVIVLALSQRFKRLMGGIN